jgi:predicted RNA-binding Zn ribbon-like protein
VVERWFKELTDKRLRRGVFTSVEDLKQAITAWAEHWNTDPKPFVWKATAEQIIAKVQRGRATLHQRFINTWNNELPADADRLGTPQHARTWRRQTQLVAANTVVSATDAARLRAIREALRALAIANVTGQHDTAATELLRTELRPAMLVVTIDDGGRANLQADRADVDGAVATLAGVLHDQQLSGNWPRLKGCRQCGYVFFDASKNRSATWCSMSICGNRSKNRAYYRRQHPPS